MTFSDKSRYNRLFQKVTHKLGESEMNYIKIFQNAQALSVSVGKIYSEDQITNILLDNFHQGGKYISQIESRQAELIREERYNDQKSLSITYPQTDYLNIDSSSGHKKRENKYCSEKFTFCRGTKHYAETFILIIRKDKQKAHAVGDLYRQQTKRTPRKCFRCEYIDHLIAKCTKPRKDNEK